MRIGWVWAALLFAGAVAIFLAVYLGPIPVSVALVLGVAAEGVGFALTFWDLVETERRVRRYLEGPRDITIRLTPIRLDARVLTPTIVMDPPPPLEARVEALERANATVEERILEAGRKARQEAEETAHEQAEFARLDAADDARRLAELSLGSRWAACDFAVWASACSSSAWRQPPAPT